MGQPSEPSRPEEARRREQLGELRPAVVPPRGRDGETQLDEADEHGRLAESPRDIPKAGWKDILLRVKSALKEDRVAIVAGSVAFFALLALFPALIALVAVYGLVATPETVEQQLSGLSSILPGQAQELLTRQLQEFTRQPAHGWGAVLGVVGALWSASTGTGRLIQAINIAYDEPEERGFFKLRGLALLLTMGFIIGLIIAVALVGAAPALLGALGLGEVGRTAVTYGRWPLLAGLMLLGLAVLYRMAPNREPPRFRWVTWGSAATTVLWIVASLGFSFYVSQFGSLGETYGSLGAVVVLMLWLFISCYVVLFGAELNSEIEAQTSKDSTTGDPRPMGQRGAQKADHLGPLSSAHH